MSNRNGRNGPAHMASSKKKSSSGSGSGRRRREPLQDNYYYEEPREQDFEEFEDVSSYSSSRRKKEDLKELERQKNKKKGSTAKKVILIVVAILLLAVAGIYCYVKFYLLDGLTVETITKNKGELGIQSEVQLDDSIKNIALYGVDARPNETQVRSDAIMIVSVDNKHGKIKMTSILRDSNVSMKIEDDDGSYYYTDDKITHAYFYGGPKLAVQTLNRNFSLNIEDYVTVDFAQMAKIVDAVGGVDIYVSGEEALEINTNLYTLSQEVANEKEYDDDFDEDKSPKIIYSDYLKNIYDTRDFAYASADEFESKVRHLNGNQAVAYGRIRYIGNDDARSVRQQNVLKGLIEAVRGKSKLEYPEMIRKLMPMCTTSLDFTDIMGMLPILFTDFTMESISVPGEEENPSGGTNPRGGWVYQYDLEEAARHIHRFIYEDGASTSMNAIGKDEHVHEVSNLRYSESSGGGDSDLDGLISSMPSGSDVSSEPSSDVSSEPSSSDVGSEPSGGDVSSEPSSSEIWVDPPIESEPDNGGGEGGGEDTGGWEEGNANGNVTFEKRRQNHA